MRQLSSTPGAVAMREKRRLHRERKVCQQCPSSHPRSARPGKATCVECAAASNTYRRRRNRERAATSKCQRCGRAPREVGVLCTGCDKKRRGYPSHGRDITSQRRREHGLCRDGCGRSAFDRTRLREVREGPPVAPGPPEGLDADRAPPVRGVRETGAHPGREAVPALEEQPRRTALVTPTQMDAFLRLARLSGQALLYVPGRGFVRVPMPAGVPSSAPPPDPIRDPAPPPPAPEGRRP